MKKVAISLSALFLALGVLSGCGEKKEEAPKEEAPKAEQTGMSGMSGMSAEQEGMSGMSGMSADQAAAPAQESAPAAEQSTADTMKEAAGDAMQAAGDATQAAGDAVKEAAGDAVDAAQAAGDAVKEAAGGAAQAAGDAMKEATGGAEQAAGSIDGEKVYRGLCFSCHDTGVANAPKLGDKAAWEPRIATGMDVLYDTALHGNPKMPAMPAKGGNPALSDDEVKAAVDWMVSQAK